MWMMLQQDAPDDYVIATGEQHTVREFAEAAFSCVGLDYRNHVVLDKELLRPAEVELLLGDAAKAKKKLGWSCQVKFKELVEEMVEADMQALSASRRR
jgi:GDPmannose 4,6-dehydratase